MEPIRFHFEVTLDDAVAVKLHQLAHSPVSQRLIRREKRVVATVAVGVGVALAGAATYFRGAPDISSVLGVAVLAAWAAWMVSPRARARRARRQLAVLFESGSPIAGITLDRDGIELKTSATTTRMHWSALGAIEYVEGRIYFRFAQGDQVIGLPLGSMPEDARSFVRTLATARLGHSGAALPY